MEKEREVHIQVIVPESMRKEFQKKCKELDITPSQWVRQKIREFLNREENK